MASKHDSDDEGQVVSDVEDNMSDAEDDHDHDHDHEVATPADIPVKPAFFQEASAGPIPFNVEKDCAFLLLEARIILKAMIEMKLKQERIASGNLMVDEIQNLLRAQKEDNDIDWITEIQELKRKLVSEVRRNHGLEHDLGSLDKKIALLIKNRNNIQSVLVQKEKKKKSKGEDKGVEFINPKNKELYSNLFYMLQTEPVYLANLLYLCSAEEMSSFLDTVILTLFGDAYSPREEFLILSLFKLALVREMKSLSSVRDLRQAETVVIKMILAYNKRKQGAEYSKATLYPLALQVVKQTDLQLDMTPTTVLRALIDQKEVTTGEKSSLDRNMPVDQILELQEVKAELANRAQQLISTAEKFLDAIINSFPRLPYGLRWICKQVQRIAAEQLPNSTQNDILSVTGYFVYYRFLSLVFLEQDLIEKPSAAKNLFAASKVLQQLFNLTTFSEKHMGAVNDWITANLGRVKKYLTEVPDVPDPEDHLKVDRYNELTQKTKPVIIISHSEISQTHQLLRKHLDNLVAPTQTEDHLRIILKELEALGPIPENIDDDHEVQLTLTNKFESHVEAEINPDKHLYSETKELVIKALSGIPVEPRRDAPPIFMDTLKRGLEHADKTGNQPLHVIIAKTIENMKKLEEKGMIKSADNYGGFLREVALEVANRQAIREQQKKEVRRLGATVKNLLARQQYMNEQISQYNTYLDKCKEDHYQGKNKKKKSKKPPTDDKVKPTKFSYSHLKRKGIISSVDESMESVIKKMDFIISSKKAGVFTVVAKLGPAEAKNVKVEMDELLECQSNGIATIDREGIMMDVNMTIHMLNKMLMK